MSTAPNVRVTIAARSRMPESHRRAEAAFDGLAAYLARTRTETWRRVDFLAPPDLPDPDAEEAPS